MAKREKRLRSKGSSGNNRSIGNSFLDKNRSKPGVVETDSGLQYCIVEQGEGSFPSWDCNIQVHQRCQLVNGTLLVDTYKENKPSEVKIIELIEGYQEGIALMRKNARYKFFIPPELAWGKKGSGNKIPPNSVLIFDVKLLDFW